MDIETKNSVVHYDPNGF